jgi:hypothetical protein
MCESHVQEGWVLLDVRPPNEVEKVGMSPFFVTSALWHVAAL